MTDQINYDEITKAIEENIIEENFNKSGFVKAVSSFGYSRRKAEKILAEMIIRNIFEVVGEKKIGKNISYIYDFKRVKLKEIKKVEKPTSDSTPVKRAEQPIDVTITIYDGLTTTITENGPKNIKKYRAELRHGSEIPNGIKEPPIGNGLDDGEAVMDLVTQLEAQFPYYDYVPTITNTIDISNAESTKKTSDPKKETPKKTSSDSEKKKKTNKKSRYTRAEALAQALQENKTGTTAENFIQQSDDIYVIRGGKGNLKESKWFFNYGMKLLLALGTAVENDGNYKLTIYA